MEEHKDQLNLIEKTKTTPNTSKCEFCAKILNHIDRCECHEFKKPKNADYPYKCLECGKEYLKERSLKIHQSMSHSEKPTVLCAICKMLFPSELDLSFHKQEVHLEDHEHFACNECGKTFRTRANLITHCNVAHTGEISFDCKICDAQFKKRSQLKVHVREAHKEKNFVCEHCEKRFFSQPSLSFHINMTHAVNAPKKHFGKNHQRWASKKNPRKIQYNCELCQTKVGNKVMWNAHMLLHAGEDVPKCEICGKTFVLKSNLTSHMKSHDLDRPYTCKPCKLGFLAETTYTDHMKIHVKVEKTLKTYQCDFCPESFETNYSFNSHVLKFHTNEEPRHKCSDCEQKFLLLRQLRQHRTNKHPTSKTFTCNSCRMRFTPLQDRLRHVETHHCQVDGFVCPKCEKTFRTEDNLNSHQCLSTERVSFNCGKCDSKFPTFERLQNHERYSHQEKKFACGSCDKTFLHKSYLSIHMQKFHKMKWPKKYLEKNCPDFKPKCTKTSKYYCELCDKKTGNKVAYTRHMRAHSKKKMYKCEECGKCFIQKENLEAHQQTHNSDLQPCCRSCGCRFLNHADYQKHLEEKQKKCCNFIMNCNICLQTFSRRCQYYSHHRKLHSKEIPELRCTKCELTLTDQFLINGTSASAMPFQITSDNREIYSGNQNESSVSNKHRPIDLNDIMIKEENTLETDIDRNSDFEYDHSPVIVKIENDAEKMMDFDFIHPEIKIEPLQM